MDNSALNIHLYEVTTKLGALWARAYPHISISVLVYRIPEELVVNANQTGLQLLPVGNERTYTMRGAKAVLVSGAGDKRHISLLFSVSAGGDLFPGQMIFAGKTSNVVLGMNKPWSAEFRTWLKEYHPNILLLFVLANCTSKLQPCDVAVQRPFKAAVHHQFAEFSIKWIADKLGANITPTEIILETSMPVLKLRVRLALESSY
ncbi:hypothetical protein R1flu_018638 [Riccia fluitans]|uniref:DDE-1 domain-containing protein n=1 Tax=Riccia fluitans TaxID=41844 RepID=A0ABD1ZHT5_9MARC